MNESNTPNKVTSTAIECATTVQKASLFTYLLILSIIVTVCTFNLINKLSTTLTDGVSIKWEKPDGFFFKNNVQSFFYDEKTHTLINRGVINAEQQSSIRELLTSHHAELDSYKSHESDYYSSFNFAIESLFYNFNTLQNKISNMILIISFLGGVLGATLRLYVDFVGNASYKNELDLIRWWPLYATRPIVGGILGFIFTVLFKSKIIEVSLGAHGSDTYWWLGLSILAGFGTIDATERLRLTSKALFGDKK